jgi:hypothetical protein
MKKANNRSNLEEDKQTPEDKPTRLTHHFFADFLPLPTAFFAWGRGCLIDPAEGAGAGFPATGASAEAGVAAGALE